MNYPKLTTISLVFCAFILNACVSTSSAPRVCHSKQFALDSAFEGGNFFSCRATSSNSFKVRIVPEDEPPINESPWYAFRLSAQAPGQVNINLEFIDGYARYWPKISFDKKHWTAMNESDVLRSVDGTQMSIALTIDTRELWISGQELITSRYFAQWINELSDKAYTETTVIGHSVQGWPIHMITTAERPEVIVLLGRQHPPEITGTLAMREFIKIILGDSQSAQDLRARYQLIVVPFLNPDGVALGHWRHNVNGVDLNRDWGPFTQPETQSVARVLEQMKKENRHIKLMLDFHSTKSDLLYTQFPEALNEPFDFAEQWFSQVRARLPDYEFKHVPSLVSEQANSKNYFHSTYKIPAMTYELGDETDRDTIKKVTPVFAQEVIKLMLERK